MHSTINTLNRLICHSLWWRSFLNWDYITKTAEPISTSCSARKICDAIETSSERDRKKIRPYFNLYWGIFVSLLALIVIYDSRFFFWLSLSLRYCIICAIVYVRKATQTYTRSHIHWIILIHSIAVSNSNSWTAHKNSPVMWTHPLINMLNIVKRSLFSTYFCILLPTNWFVCMAVSFFAIVCFHFDYNTKLTVQLDQHFLNWLLNVRRTFYFCCSFHFIFFS